MRPGTAATAEAMTVPQRRLAGLWPWLLMAALQVVLGQPGLESERPFQRAVIKVALLNQESTGKPITLQGVFVRGSAGRAEGKLMQVRCNKALNVFLLSAHSLSSCTPKHTKKREFRAAGWAPVVQPGPHHSSLPCNSALKALRNVMP